MVSVSHLSFSYGKKQILKDISFSVDKGECIAVLGANGSGKSTLISILAGVLKGYSGEIQVPEKVGYVPQGTGLFEDMTVWDNLKFFSGLHKEKITEDNLIFGLRPYKNVKISRLSGGTAKRVSIVAALFGKPELLLLDEPFAGLDEANCNALIQVILDLKKAGVAIIYAGHDPEHIKCFADKEIQIH